MIRKISRGRWRVVSRSGRNIGTFRNKSAASKRLRRVDHVKA